MNRNFSSFVFYICLFQQQRFIYVSDRLVLGTCDWLNHRSRGSSPQDFQCASYGFQQPDL